MDKIKFKMFGGRKKKEKMKPIFEEFHNAYSTLFISEQHTQEEGT